MAPLWLGQEAASCALQGSSGWCVPCCAVPAADTGVKKALNWNKGLTTPGSHLSAEGTFHLLFLTRNRHGCSPLFVISIHSDLVVPPSPGRAQCTLTEGSCPSLPPPPSIVKTCATVPFWKPFNHVPVVQARAQACKCTKLSSAAYAGVLISVKTHKTQPIENWLLDLVLLCYLCSEGGT